MWPERPFGRRPRAKPPGFVAPACTPDSTGWPAFFSLPASLARCKHRFDSKLWAEAEGVGPHVFVASSAATSPCFVENFGQHERLPDSVQEIQGGDFVVMKRNFTS